MGIAFKIINPEMPFILRIGYVFIVLSFVMVGISLLDKRHTADNVTDGESAGRKIKLGARMIAAAMLTGIVMAFFVGQFKNLALEAGYVLLLPYPFGHHYPEQYDRRNEWEGFHYGESIFETTPVFNIAAIGICGILALLTLYSGNSLNNHSSPKNHGRRIN
jgi:SSS family solute:Na+ symporter